jgi:hypothetical protein
MNTFKKFQWIAGISPWTSSHYQKDIASLQTHPSPSPTPVLCTLTLTAPLRFHPQPLKAYCQSPYGEIPVSRSNSVHKRKAFTVRIGRSFVSGRDIPVTEGFIVNQMNM